MGEEAGTEADSQHGDRWWERLCCADVQRVPRALATSPCHQGPLCQTPISETSHLPLLHPRTPSSARGAAMCSLQCLVLLASLLPPGMVPLEDLLPPPCQQGAGFLHQHGLGAGVLVPWSCQEPCVMPKG